MMSKEPDPNYDQSVADLKDYYSSRNEPFAPPRESGGRRNRHNAEVLKQAGLLPLGNRTLLDVGCWTGGWLWQACQLWGGRADCCAGVDVLAEAVASGRQMFPGLDLRVSSAHELPWPDDSFDLVHTSMMFSSITDAGFRRTIAAEMWRVLRPSGHVLWFDFILNPLNRHTSGMWKSDIRRLFPEAEWRQTRRICLPPPVERLLLRVSPSFAGLLERLKFLNSYYLVLLRKNARAGPLETG